MYDNYTEMEIEGLTRGRELNDALILVLSAKGRSQLVPVLLDAADYDKVLGALKNKDYSSTRLMNRLATRVGLIPIGVRLMPPRSGKMRALIDFALINDMVSLSASAADGVVAAAEAHVSLYMPNELIEQQKQMPSNGAQMALPITAMNNSLLEEAMHSAVQEDNFELARVLRDELSNRNHLGEKNEQ